MTNEVALSQEPSFISKATSVFNSVQQCLNNSTKIKEKIVQFNNNVSSVIRDGCAEIDSICSRVKQRLSEMEASDHQICKGVDIMSIDESMFMLSQGDASQNMNDTLNNVDNLTDSFEKKFHFTNDSDTEADTSRLMSDSMNYSFVQDAGNDAGEKILAPRETQPRKEQEQPKIKKGGADGEPTRKNFSADTTEQWAEVNVPVKDTEQEINEVLKCKLMLDKINKEEIYKDVDDSLRAISKINVSASLLVKYELRCDLLREKLKYIAKDVYECLNEHNASREPQEKKCTPQVEDVDGHLTEYEIVNTVASENIDEILDRAAAEVTTARDALVEGLGLGLKDTNAKDEETETCPNLNDVEMARSVDESLKAISQIYDITNSLLKNLTNETPDDKPDGIGRPTKANSPEPPRLSKPRSCSSKTFFYGRKNTKKTKDSNPKHILRDAVSSLKKKLQLQKDVKGTYFNDIEATVKSLSSNFDIMNKLVDSVNKDIVKFSCNVEEDSVKGDSRKGRRPKRPTRSGQRPRSAKRVEFADRFEPRSGSRTGCRPITPVVNRKRASTNLYKKWKSEAGSKYPNGHKKLLVTVGQK